MRQVGIAPKFSATPGSVRSLAPRRGEHTDEMLREAGYSQSEIEAMGAEGIAG